MCDQDLRKEVDMEYIENLTPEDVRNIILGPPSSEQIRGSGQNSESNLEVMRETEGVGVLRKRNRGSSEDDEGFIMVTGKKRRNYSGPSLNSPVTTISPSENTLSCEVSVSAKIPLPKQLGLAKLLKKEETQGVVKVTYKSPFRVLIQFKTEREADIFLGSRTVKEREWTCRKTNDITYSYGVIRDVDIDIEEEDLKEIFSSEVPISFVKRLFKKNEKGEWVKSESVRICFKGPIMPPYVKAYGCRMNVGTFMYPVTQCSKCWRYGHIKRFCPSKVQLCPKCGKKHESCDTTEYKCVNCKGNHMSIVKSMCPIFQKERQIRIIMGQNNCTYKEALQRFNDSRKEKGDNRNEDILRDEDFVRLIEPLSQQRQEEQCHVESDSNNEPSEPRYRDISINSYSAIVATKTSLKNHRSQPQADSLKSKKQSKTRNMRRNKKNREVVNNGSSEEGEISTEVEEPRSIHSHKDRKNLLQRFLDKLKEIIFSEKNFQAKVMGIIVFIWTEIKGWFENSFLREAMLNFINQQYGK